MDPNSDIQDDDNLMNTVDKDWDTRVIVTSPGYEQMIVDQFGYDLLTSEKERLGKGGFGTVFTCIRNSDGKKLAVKMIELLKGIDAPTAMHSLKTTDVRKWVNHPKAKKKGIDCKHEIKIMKACDHRNFVKYIDHFLINGMAYIVMEIEHGAMDEQLLCYFNGMSEKKAKNWFHQICNGFQFMHGIGIIHRDIKPPNILIRKLPDGTTMCKISDFGLSRFRTEADPRIKGSDEVGVDRLVTVVGTPEFIAPEMLRLHWSLREEEEARGIPIKYHEMYDGRISDVWALGVTLYDMLFGALPFPTSLARNYDKMKDYLAKMEGNHWSIPFLARGTTSRATVDFLKRMIHPNPETRITSDVLPYDLWFKGDIEEPGFRTLKVRPPHGWMAHVQKNFWGARK